jgi:transposase
MTLIAMDVHKNSSTIAALHPATGEIIIRKCLTDRNDIARKLADLPRPWTVAVESSRHSPPVCRWLEALGGDVKLVHPEKLSKIADLYAAKTDAKDAETMLMLLHLDCLPECYLAPEDVVELRDLCRGRNSLREVTNKLCNLLRSSFARAGMMVNYTDLTGCGARALVPELMAQMGPLGGLMARMFWQLLELVEGAIAQVERHIGEQAHAHPVAAELCGDDHPGMREVLALALVAEIGEMERFASPAHLHSYAGLVPRTSESGDSRHEGSLPQRCNKHLRRVAVQIAQNAVRCRAPNPAKDTYERLREERGKGPNTAKIAAARKVLTEVFFTWRGIAAASAS